MMAAAAEPEQRVKLKTRRKEESEAQALKREKKKKRKKDKSAAGPSAPSLVDEDSLGGLVIDEASSDSIDVTASIPLPTTPKRDALAVLLEQCAGSTTSTPSLPKPAPTAEDKKRRPWKNTVKTYYQLPLDSNGEPKLPILIGSMVIHSLGKIDPSDAFHAKRYIWPLGFRSTRPYGSMLDFAKRTEYTSEIKMDPMSYSPMFVVTPADDLEHPVISATASGAWTEIVKRISEARKAKTGKQMFTTVSGPEMFGFAHPAVAKLIQDMPGARQCTKYLRQEFVLSSASRKVPKKTDEADQGPDDEITLGNIDAAEIGGGEESGDDE